MQFVGRMVAACLVIVISPPAMHSQAAPTTLPLDSGTTVRVITMHDQVAGQLLRRHARDDSSIRLCTPQWIHCDLGKDSVNIRTIPASDVQRLEVHRGNHAGTGMIAGGLLGALLGGAMVSSLCESADPCVGGMLKGGVVFGFTLGTVGALIGLLFPGWGEAR